VNAIRLYNVNPTTRLASERLLNTGWNDILEPLGKDHRQFMDYAQAYGIKVMFPLVGDETALTNDSEELLNQKIMFVCIAHRLIQDHSPPPPPFFFGLGI